MKNIIVSDKTYERYRVFKEKFGFRDDDEAMRTIMDFIDVAGKLTLIDFAVCVDLKKTGLLDALRKLTPVEMAKLKNILGKTK